MPYLFTRLPGRRPVERSRYRIFIQNLVQDALLWVFLLVVLSGFRAAFLGVFHNALLPHTPWQDIVLTLWYGLRISLKTAGACVLPCFVLGTLVQTWWVKWPGGLVRAVWAAVVLVGLSLLFQARIPYYHEFHNAFSPFVFNTFNDDVWAIVSTAIDQYQAVWRVLAGVVCGVVLLVVWGLLVKRFTAPLVRPFLAVNWRKTVVVLICLVLVPFAVFVRKGGSFTFNGSIYWKNAARMNQHVLNEAILDDVQALYKASRIYKKLKKSAAQVEAPQVRAAAARLLGQTEYSGEDLTKLLARTAPGADAEKPTHIFVIVAETYMMWPLLEKYETYPLARGLRRLLARPDALLVQHFLPASNGTMFGLTSVLLGIPELNLQAANRPTAQQPYETALSVQLRQQGYKTRFFYGGFSSWENVGLFMEHQQIDERFYAADFGGKGGVWGVPDREFLQGVAEKIDGTPSFNLILTSSNHPPYKVDMSREPDLPAVTDLENQLPAQTADKALTAARMWHFAYADKYLAEFVETLQAKYPNSLFVITGDHADRWTMTPTPSDYERIAVPLVLIGPQVQAVNKPTSTAGSHMDIAATVLEMVLPKDAPYYALGHNLLADTADTIPLGVSAYYWITPQEMGRVSENATELLPGQNIPLTPTQREEILRRAKDLQTVAAWRVLNGLPLAGR